MFANGIVIQTKIMQSNIRNNSVLSLLFGTAEISRRNNLQRTFNAASLLKASASVNFQHCPMCGKRHLEIIPVGDHQSYKMSIDKKRGIEIEFVKEK